MDQNKISKFLLIFFAIWFGMTCAVDFVAVPLAFRTIPSREFAGNYGIAVFSMFNKAEVLLAIISFVFVCLLNFKRKRAKKILITISIILFALSLSYLFYISPTISELTAQIHKALPVQQMQVVESQHDFYHRLYVKLDSLKLILLLCGMGLCFERVENGVEQ